MKIAVLIRKENSNLANEYYIKGIERFSGEVVLIKDSYDIKEVESLLKGVNGILLTGGDEVGPLDFYLIEYAINNNLKLLGICQGMQSMALYGSNDKLISINNSSHNSDKKYVHSVYLKPGKLMRLLDKDKLLVNSHHLQTVKNSYKFIVSGYSNDGLIEVVEGCRDTFQVGVQWHPERMLDYDVDSRKILEKFVSS